MNPLAIRVENLGKRYRLGTGTDHHRLSEVFYGIGRLALGVPRRWLTGWTPPKRVEEDFWALQDIAFDVRRGEVIGIVGRNGSGKSTLLKILSRITEPTNGRFGLRGRLVSLLEVWTVFQPELTGRENVFLNGTVLGMSRAEIRRKFDQIAAFAEIDQFLDTPVKRYSSGMYVRLAFATAAHVEPDILIVDEVLAVGDTLFQQKCLRKVREVSTRDGCTVLLVNHNTAAVRRLCSRALWLDKGRLVLDGPVNTVLDRYEEDCGVTPALAGIGVLGAEDEELPTVAGPALLPVPATLPFAGDFTPNLAQHFVVRSGNWQVGSGVYRSNPAPNETGISTLVLEQPPPRDLDIRLTVSPRSGTAAQGCNAFVLFDFADAKRFKFVGVGVTGGTWVVGQHEAGEWMQTEEVPESLEPNRDYALEIALRGPVVTLSVNGVVKLRHTYTERLDGTIGLATRNALTWFRRLEIRPALTGA